MKKEDLRSKLNLDLKKVSSYQAKIYNSPSPKINIGNRYSLMKSGRSSLTGSNQHPFEGGS